MKQYAALNDTVYFWFAANDTSGSGGDGATPAADIRLAGAAADAAPVYSPTPTLLSHVNYPAGAYEIAIAATAANGFATNNTYAIFCTLAIDAQNPTGFVGSFDLKSIQAQVKGLDDGVITAAKIAADAIGASEFAQAAADKVWGTAAKALTDKADFALSTAAINAIADQVWDEILTGATHNIATSAGKRLRQIGAYAIFDGTAQAGTATTITLAATTNGGDGIINRNLIVIVAGIGIGQTRWITDYNDTSKVCIIDRDWRITPDNTSEYQILADDEPLVMDHGVARGGTSTTITLRDYASSEDDIYHCNMVAIIGGTGRGQSRLVYSYNGTTKVVTICGKDWDVIPDTTSVYMLVPYGTTCTSCLDAHALAQINAECNTALADYSPALEATLTTIKGTGWTDETLKAIKEYVDELESGEKPIPVPKSIGEAEENKL